MKAQTNLNVLIFSGSSSSVAESHREFARGLAREIAVRGHNILYGGGGLGLMGIVADTALSVGGRVVGVIPEFLNREDVVTNKNANLIVVPDLQARKQIMFSRANVTIALPGGIGTLEELTELMTLKQLGQHDGEVLLANVDGYWNKFIDLIEFMRAEKYMSKGHDLVFHSFSEIQPILKFVDDLAAERTVGCSKLGRGEN